MIDSSWWPKIAEILCLFLTKNKILKFLSKIRTKRKKNNLQWNVKRCPESSQTSSFLVRCLLKLFKLLPISSRHKFDSRLWQLLLVSSIGCLQKKPNNISDCVVRWHLWLNQLCPLVHGVLSPFVSLVSSIVSQPRKRPR